MGEDHFRVVTGGAHGMADRKHFRDRLVEGAELTDVTEDDFGEGSFDKGVSVEIPFRWTVPFETRANNTIALTSVSRDGVDIHYGELAEPGQWGAGLVLS